MVRANKWLLLLGASFALAGCHTDMWTQAKVTDFDEDDFGTFGFNGTARPIPTGAVARGWEKLDAAKYTGFDGNKYTTKFPAELTLDGVKLNTSTEMATVLKRGKERYHIYCSHCHGDAGDGKGMITQRGLVLRREPPTYHSDRLRNMPVGYFYDVITNGYGIMYSQAARVKPDDRWAIIAYIRTLQLSQNVPGSQLTPQDKEKMQSGNDASHTPEGEGH